MSGNITYNHGGVADFASDVGSRSAQLMEIHGDILHRTNAIPWNYARFLNHCTERLLLQRVGGRYRFIHRLVQDRFAATGGHRL